MTEREKTNHVLEVFHDFIVNQSYFDIAFTVLSDECLYICGTVFEEMDTAEKLCEYILTDLWYEFYDNNDLRYQEKLTEEQRAQLLSRMNAFVQFLPEYQHLIEIVMTAKR